MQLHFSWTVLVTIIWTILLSNSAKGTTPKKTRALGLEKTPIGLTETIDTSWRLENTIKTIQSAGPNVETKSPSDITKRRIITGNDMAGKMVGNAVEKRHVREQSLSQETPISSKYGKNNENAETESFQGKDNDGDGIFRHRSKLSLKRNIPMTHYTNGGLGSSEKHQLNVPRELTTESVSLEHDNVVPNQASTKSSPYDEEEEAARPVRTSAIAVSLIDGSNSSGVNYQSLKSSLQTHTSKYRDSIDSKVSEGERSKEKTRFARDSSFNDDPSGKDQPFHKALFEAHTSGEHQDVSSPEPRDPLSFFKTHSETENIGKRKEDEETFIERGPYLLGKTSTMWEKQRDRNVPGTIRENSFVNGPLDSNEILEYEVNGETKSSQRRQDPSVSNELSNIEAADKQEVKKLPASAQAIQGNSEDSGFSVPTFFQIPENLLEKEANRVFESSGDVGSRLMASAKMSSESSKGLSKQIAGSPTHGIQTKMDSSTETPNDQDFPDGRHLGTPGSSSPETRQFYQQQKFKEGLAKINHLGDGKDEHGSPSVSSLNNKASDTKSDEARIIGGNKNRRNISKGLGLDDTENNVHGGWSMSQVSDDNRRSRWDQEFTDNPSSQDIKMKVHGEVVKTELTGLQRDRRAHKTFIGQNSVGDTNLGSYQTAKRQVLVQEPKKYRQKLTFDTTPIEVNGFLSLEEAVPSFQKTLVNSEASSSLWPEVKREKTLSDLNTKLSTDGTRKMELAGEDTQGAVNIRTFKDDEAGKEISLSEEPSKMGPRSMQFLQASSTENNTSSDDAVSNAENRGNSIQGIFQAVPTDTSLSMGSPRAKIYSRDFVSDRTDHHVHESDRNRHSEFLESKSQLDRELFYRATESDRREKVTSNFREKSDVRSVKTSNIHSSDMQSDKIQRAGRVNSAAENFETVSTAPKIGRDQIDDRFQNKTIQNHDHQRDMKIITSRKNYIGQVQTDETNAISIIDRSQLHDQIGSKKNDSLEKQRKRRNHSNDEIPKVVECDTCNIIEDVDTNGNGRTRTFHFVHHEERSNEKGARFVTETSVPKSLLPLEITREYGVPVDATVTDGPGNSLAATSSELEAIAHLEERVDERLRWKNIETLVRSQQKIAVESLANDFRSSRDPTSTLQPSAVNIGKLKDTDERNASADSMLDQSNGSSSSPNGEAETREVGPPGKKPASRYEKFEIRPSRSKEALANKRRKKFPDNGDDVSRDQGNFRPSSIPSKGNVSGNVNFVNTLVHQTDTTTTSTMSTMKIDSAVGLIDQTSHRLEFTRRKEYIDDAEPRIWPGGNSRAIGKMYNVRKKQIKRAFTENSTASVTDTKTTTRDSPDYKTSSTRRKDDISNAKSIEVSGDIEKTAKVTNKTLRIPVADWTMSNFSSTRNLNPIYSNSTSYSSNPNVNPIRNSSQTFETVLNQEQRLQPHQDHLLPADKMKESIDNRILNQTIHDNSTRVTNTLNQWPVKHSAVVEGDLVLGGLMMVHEREDSVTCGPVMPQGGVQALEAMLYTLDWVNKRDLVPGVKIGAHILDDCDKDTYGLEMAVDFIKGSISNIDGAEYHCNKTAVRKVISGVVGAASSVTSIQVANLLRLFRIPQVSFFSTSPELSNKMRFEYFTRTIPSDHYQVQAMVDIVLQMGWSYVSIIYEESNYGEKAYEELEKLLGKHQICIAVKEKLSKDSGVAEAHVYDNIVQKLLTKPRARGCIIFASDQEVAGVMRAVRRCNATGAFSWIGSDGWSARSLVSDGNEREMEGTLSVQPQANPVQGFEDYFLNLTVENNRRNPWFVEFWEDHFKCRYPNSSRTPYNNYTEECTTTERLTRENTAFEDQLQFVSDAVLAFAHAFRNMHSVLCHGKPGLCDAMKPTKGIELLNYLRNVEFDGLTGDVFHFDKNGDGPARYNIIHFKQISPGEYKWIRVGKYLEGELRLNMSEIQFRLGHPEAPESVCSLPCEVGQAKKYVEGESCCWHCFNCSQDEIRHISDEKQCVLCPKGTLPDQTHSYCRDIPEEFLRPESGWAIGAMSFSSTGILITLFVGGVFLKHNDTPIVRASGRELSYVLLTGILLCYLVTFALVLRPTDLVCSIQRFSAGFCFTVMYAALLTKTNRISRIFNAGKRSAKRPSFISPRSQLIICSMLVAVQILIHAVWMVIDPAKARHHYPTREDNLLVCNSYIDASYMIAFTYPIILIVVCTVYAVLTRKIPEAFNESKHIGFTMYTTCVIWLAFVPLYFATGSHVALRITSMSVTISLSATVTIACLFTPKLYIILIHPERNVRPNMMHHRYNTTKGSVVTATNASSMMAPVTLTAVTCDQNKAVKKHAVTTMDCSTQSEQFEVETKERQNGKIPAAALINRSTQTTLNNNGTDSTTATSPIIKDIGMDENNESVKGLIIGKIGNGPLAQNEVPL